MRLVGPLLAMEAGAISAPRLVATVFALEAFVARPRLDQGPIHGEVLVAHHLLAAWGTCHVTAPVAGVDVAPGVYRDGLDLHSVSVLRNAHLGCGR